MFSELHLAKISPILALRHCSATGADASEDQIGWASVCRQGVEPLVMRSPEHINNFATGWTNIFLGACARIVLVGMLPYDVIAMGALDGHILRIGAHGQQCAEFGAPRQLRFDSSADRGTIRIHI